MWDLILEPIQSNDRSRVGTRLKNQSVNLRKKFALLLWQNVLVNLKKQEDHGDTSTFYIVHPLIKHASILKHNEIRN